MKKTIFILLLFLVATFLSVNAQTVGVEKATASVDTIQVKKLSSAADSSFVCWKWEGQRALTTVDFRGCKQNFAYFCSLEHDSTLVESTHLDTVITHIINWVAVQPCTERDPELIELD